MNHPKDVGIKGIALHIPGQCVDQHALETHDGVSPGKYTIGLGQTRMAFCNDREDIYSMALTAVSSLMRDYAVRPSSIGRLEVGTETILDKSKSVKSVLMQLFRDTDGDIEGVDNVNACYGGTAALLNTLNWIESAAWDGRDAIVVAGDIALYDKGNARPTGGAGCVAMLIGPGAPLAIETNLRASYMRHEYDFYKPDLTSEYPIVDGPLSLQCYTEALDRCYKGYMSKLAIASTVNPDESARVQHNADTFDYMCFHSPTCKTVKKAYARLFYHDYLAQPEHEDFVPVPSAIQKMSYPQSLFDKGLEKTFMSITQERFEHRVKPAIEVATLCGNMYTASLYSSLCSLLGFVLSSKLQGKRVGMFSYGSGLASTLFSIRVIGSTEEMSQRLNLRQRLAGRTIASPMEYDAACKAREHAHLKCSYRPTGSTECILTGTYYLTNIDDKFRREYDIQKSNVQAANATPDNSTSQELTKAPQATSTSDEIAGFLPITIERSVPELPVPESRIDSGTTTPRFQRADNASPGHEPRPFLQADFTSASIGVISVISLNLPQTRNAISKAMIQELNTFLLDLHQRPPAHTRALVIASSTPGIFCAGADLKERARMSDAETREYLSILRETFNLLESLPLPTIASLSGPALGGGLEMALACHFRVASEDVVLGLPETQYLAIIPGAGGTFRLPALIGTARARDLILTGRRVGLPEAQTIGLLDRVSKGGNSPSARLQSSLDLALDLATEIVSGAPLAVRAALRALRDPGGPQETREYESVLGSRDRNEALKAFRSKRKPIFVGA